MLIISKRKKDVKKWLEARSRKSLKSEKSLVCQKLCLARVQNVPKILLSRMLSDNKCGILLLAC